MLLAKIALYIFIFTFVMYLAHRALWLIFFLFNFRFWEMIMMQFTNEFFASLTPIQKFLILTLLSIVSYLSIFFTTIKMPLIRYIFLAVMFIASIRVYDISDIFLFKDYLVESGMWGFDYWVGQIKSVFSLESGGILKLAEEVMGVFVNFFVKIVEAVRAL